MLRCASGVITAPEVRSELEIEYVTSNKLAARQLTVQIKLAGLVSRLCNSFGVTPPELTPFSARYMTPDRMLARNEAVADALESIVDAIAPTPLASGADPDSGNATPVDGSPVASTAPEALDHPVTDTIAELETFADELADAIGGADFIPEGDEEPPFADPVPEIEEKVEAPKPSKPKGKRK